MIFADPKEFTDIEQAQAKIETLQQRLLDCEQKLDDIARCAEICMITNQFHLLSSFVDAANQYLVDRIDLIELSERKPAFDQKNIEIIEDGLSAKSTQHS